MSLNQLINRTCVLLQRSPGDEDDYGNEVMTDTAVETVCELQQVAPGVRVSERGEGEISDDLWTIIFKAGEDLSTADAVVVDGQVYEFVGDPWDARNPRTQLASHIEVTARRTAGSEDAS